MSSSSMRSPFWIATAVAIPVMILAGYGVYQGLASSTSLPEEDETPVDDSPVSVEMPVIGDDETAVICRALLAQSPDEVVDHEARGIEPAGDEDADGISEVAAAWGDPALVMRCGVDEVEVADTDVVYQWGETCWAVEEGDDADVWTSLDRQVPVEVMVPAAYEQSGELVSVLSPVVGEAVPASDEAPSGCGD